jgi:RNA polymerase sigma-70 factor (ECF subfamily)
MTATELDLITAARHGDREAYNLLVSPLRAELHAHCYRMLGSAADAEDAVQEALLNAWRGLSRFEGRSSVRTWLYRIATNACLKAIRRRPMRMLPIDYGPATDPHDSFDLGARLVESVWIQPIPTANFAVEQRESVGLAFVAALQHLPPRQRASLLLRDVLGYSARETAEMLDATPTSIDSSLQRARKTVQQKLSGRHRLEEDDRLDSRGLARIADQYVEAWERGDVELLATMLTNDATLSMPPIRVWLQGRVDVIRFLATNPMADAFRWRVIRSEANGQPAFAHYLFDESTRSYLAHSITVIRVRGGQIADTDAFCFPDLFPIFDLPSELS